MSRVLFCKYIMLKLVSAISHHQLTINNKITKDKNMNANLLLPDDGPWLKLVVTQ